MGQPNIRSMSRRRGSVTTSPVENTARNEMSRMLASSKLLARAERLEAMPLRNRGRCLRSAAASLGLASTEIRELSKERGLPTWDKPAMACLSSRIPYGSPVTIEALDQIEAAEAFLRSLGLRELRVRHHGSVARIELDESGMAVLMRTGRRQSVVERFKQLGFAYVTLDLAGFRSGSMNEVLRKNSGHAG